MDFDKSLPDTDSCSVAMHAQYRSVLGHINWLQPRTQYQACYRFSRGASAAAGPTIGDVRALHQLDCSIRADHCFFSYGHTKANFVGRDIMTLPTEVTQTT
ncbi:MAG: hypothetical protein ACKPKO_06090, partial [Candidatus Fonsibacter sp.]